MGAIRPKRQKITGVFGREFLQKVSEIASGNDRANWGARTSRTIQRNGLLMAIQRNGPLQFHCVDSCREAIFQTITKRLQAGSDEPVLQVIAIHQDILSH